jgi:hypothetical protein
MEKRKARFALADAACCAGGDMRHRKWLSCGHQIRHGSGRTARQIALVLREALDPGERLSIAPDREPALGGVAGKLRLFGAKHRHNGKPIVVETAHARMVNRRMVNRSAPDLLPV